MQNITGFPAMIMKAAQIAKGHEITGDLFHAMAQHPECSVEDVWGYQKIEAIGRCYAMVRWMLKGLDHRAMTEEACRIRSTAKDDVTPAETLIQQYRKSARSLI